MQSKMTPQSPKHFVVLMISEFCNLYCTPCVIVMMHHCTTVYNAMKDIDLCILNVHTYLYGKLSVKPGDSAFWGGFAESALS